MPGRSATFGTQYRFGFNGFEKDDEVKSAGNHISFGNYGYDPRIGRRWNIDPDDQADISGYAVFNNNPNFFVDPDGQSPISIFAKLAAKAGLKKAAKEFVESQIKKRLTAYMSKSWAKQLGKDALDFVDKATATSWWEYAVEAIPVVGDIYGGAQLTKQGLKVWKGIERFERLANNAATIATKAWNKIDLAKGLKGKGGDVLGSVVDKTNRIGDHLTESDLVGAVRDIYGNPIMKSNGKAFDHLGEVDDALTGLGNQLSTLRKQIDNGTFSSDTQKAAESLFKQLQNKKDEIQNVLNKAKKEAKE